MAHSGERAVGVGGRGRQRGCVVGDAGVASQDPAQEVQVRRAGDIRGAGGVGGMVAGAVSFFAVWSAFWRSRVVILPIFSTVASTASTRRRTPRSRSS